MASDALFDSSLLRRGLFDEDFPTGALFDPWMGVEDPPPVYIDRVLNGTDHSGSRYGSASSGGSKYSSADRSGSRYRGL